MKSQWNEIKSNPKAAARIIFPPLYIIAIICYGMYQLYSQEFVIMTRLPIEDSWLSRQTYKTVSTMPGAAVVVNRQAVIDWCHHHLSPVETNNTNAADAQNAPWEDDSLQYMKRIYAKIQ